MPYCVSARQPKAILSNADEILVNSNDIAIIPELFYNYPKKTIILDLDQTKEINWGQLQSFNKLGTFVCRIKDLSVSQDFVSNGVNFFYYYPINSFFELNALIELKPYYIIITTPLVFNLPALAKIQQEWPDIRYIMSPTDEYGTYLPNRNSFYGGFVRPEDIHLYDSLNCSYVFPTRTLKQEAALVKIYFEDKVWNGDLSRIIPNLNISLDNRAFPDNFGLKRSKCNHKCQEDKSNCHYCLGVMAFSNAITTRPHG